MPNKFDKIKDLQRFLGLLNYVRNFIKDLDKVAGPLYSNTETTGQKKFNTKDIKLLQELTNMMQQIPDLAMPLETDYLIVKMEDK